MIILTTVSKSKVPRHLYLKRNGRLRIVSLTLASSGWSSLGRDSGVRCGLSASFAPNKMQRRLAQTAPPLRSLPPSSGLRSCPFTVIGCFVRCRSSEEQNSRRRRKGQKMGFHSNSKTNNNGNGTRDIIAANIQALIEQLEAGRSEVITQYLTAMARFHNYSFGNILMIAAQKPEAVHVAGIRTWNQLGRRVKRGEKGIMIFAPMIGKRRNSPEDGTTKTEQTSDARSASGVDVRTHLVGFRRVYVWDMSQTEGEDLPKPSQVKGDAGSYLERLVRFVEAQGITLE